MDQSLYIPVAKKNFNFFFWQELMVFQNLKVKVNSVLTSPFLEFMNLIAHGEELVSQRKIDIILFTPDKIIFKTSL